MPQHKKKGRQTNKKKNKKGRAGHSVSDSNNNSNNNNNSRPGGNASSQGRTKQKNALLAQETFLKAGANESSNFELYEERRRKNILQQDYSSIYVRYKDATRRFCKYMVDQTPEYVEGNRNSVNFLVIAADWMVENNFEMDSLILKDLKIALRIRSRVAKSVFGGGDGGHKHFLLVLTYCWTTLISLPRMSITKIDEDKDTPAQNNKFDILMTEEDDDREEEMDQEIFPSTVTPRPEPEPDTAMTLEELMGSDARNDVILFLITVDELMMHVSLQYEVVTKNYLNGKRRGYQESIIVEDMLEAAVLTNMAIQQVQVMEMDLQLQHSHLNTPYRLLSTLVLPQITQHVAEIVREHGKNHDTGSNLEKDIVIFLGDCLECHIRNKSDPFNKSETIVSDFCKKMQINQTGSSEIQDIFRGLHLTMMMELPLLPEKHEVGRMLRRAQSLAPGVNMLHSHSWLGNFSFIGGDRDICHTLRLLQAFGDIIRSTPDDKQIIPRRGFFGQSPWRPGRVRKIHGDLDELLMSDILPQWFLMCRNGIWGKMKLPRDTEICNLFVVLRNYVENPTATISWSLTFAVHAMLTSILDTDQISDQLVTLSQTVFNNYFSQLDFAINFSKKEPEMMNNNKVWQQNMINIQMLQNLGHEAFHRRAIWNPLCGGTNLSYMCFFGNLEVGSTLIDCQAQLRIVLHLFHALKVTGILRQEGQILLLDILHKRFKSSRGIWEGPLPQRGEFVKRFWICFGASPAYAKKMSEAARRTVQEHQIDDLSKQGKWKNRKMSPVEPAEVSTSYRRICNQDFHDAVDKYHSPEQRSRGKGTVMYEFEVRAHDTLDSIDAEQELLNINLPSCGAILEQFVCSLGIILQWEPLLATTSGEWNLDGSSNKRQGFAFFFAQLLLGALDFANNPSEYEFLNVPMGTASSHFMNIFFNKLDQTKILWFQASE